MAECDRVVVDAMHVGDGAVGGQLSGCPLWRLDQKRQMCGIEIVGRLVCVGKT